MRRVQYHKSFYFQGHGNGHLDDDYQEGEKVSGTTIDVEAWGIDRVIRRNSSYP
jgi:hypothetical protein